MVFDPFGDYETHGYLRNFIAEKNLARIRRMEHHAFAANVLPALANLRNMQTIDYVDVTVTHAILFRKVYPWAGHDRKTTSPDVAVTKGGHTDLFARPHDIERNANYALALGNYPATMRAHPGTVFAALTYAHPFLDGNDQTLMTVHADLARRAGFHIEWHNIETLAFLEALTADVKQPSQAMDRLLAPHIRPGGIPIEDASERLTGAPGLNDPPAGPSP